MLQLHMLPRFHDVGSDQGPHHSHHLSWLGSLGAAPGLEEALCLEATTPTVEVATRATSSSSSKEAETTCLGLCSMYIPVEIKHVVGELQHGYTQSFAPPSQLEKVHLPLQS